MSEIEKVNSNQYVIKKKGNMNANCTLFLNEKLMKQVEQEAIQQIKNVSTLPGIVGNAFCMPDMHSGYGFCVSKGTKVLSSFGFHKQIETFHNDWNNISLKTLSFKSKLTTDTQIKKFLKIKSKNKVIKLITQFGNEIMATEDHPFYTPKGMILLKDLNINDQVAIYPFEGVLYEKPSDKKVYTEADIKKTLLRLGRIQGQNNFDQNILALKKRDLLSLTFDDIRLQHFLKIIGFVLGDGTMNFIGKKQDGIVSFSSKDKLDLEYIREDIKHIGYVPSQVYSHISRTIYKGEKKTNECYCFYVNASSLVILLHTLEIPLGNRTYQSYSLPKWVFSCKLWQKRLFLASFFGAELRIPHRRKDRFTLFNCPVLTMNKIENLISNGKQFLKDISKLLKEFGVNTLYITKRKKHISTKGKVTWGLDLVISSEIDTLINLWSKIGFEYNINRNFMANVAVQYLKYKKKILAEKKMAIEIIIPKLLNTGLSYQKIAKQVANDSITERSVINICLKINKGQKNIPVQVSRNFISFKDFFEKVTNNAGFGGLIWDNIKSMKVITNKNIVYDFTVTHQDHNFIANKFVVSNCIGGVAAFDYKNGVVSPGGIGFDINCGVRLLTSNVQAKEITKNKKQILNELFASVPSGVGIDNKEKLSKEDFNDLIKNGIDWAIKNKYATKKDKECIEDYGKLDASEKYLSQRAVARGLSQIGTLGSGNHFLEVQVVDEVFDASLAKAWNLERGTITVMIHTGSRGFGHQVATDFIKVFLDAKNKYNLNYPDSQLACVPIQSEEGKQYLQSMNAAANFAYVNRQMITYRLRKVFEKYNIDLELLYDVAHNIAKKETYVIDGKKRDVLVHRKGATRAFAPGNKLLPKKYLQTGQPVILPGSMGTCSYVLVGEKAEELSFGSVSHGAGRIMSRSGALKNLTYEHVLQELTKNNIEIKTQTKKGIVEEAPESYKDVSEVVNVLEKNKLAKPVVKLKPIMVMKG